MIVLVCPKSRPGKSPLRLHDAVYDFRARTLTGTLKRGRQSRRATFSLDDLTCEHLQRDAAGVRNRRQACRQGRPLPPGWTLPASALR